MNALRFVVYGRPQPAGSKRAYVRGARAVVVDANPNATPWKQEVARTALAAADGAAFAKGTPLSLEVWFVLARPKGHYGTGRNVDVLKPSAPACPTSMPDTTKLLRGLEDALTAAGVWHDDAQVVIQIANKIYGYPERCEVAVNVVDMPSWEVN